MILSLLFRYLSQPALVFILFICLSNCNSPSEPAGEISSRQLSTEFGRTAWTDYAEFRAETPGKNLYIGAWTHTVEPMGYGTVPNPEGYTGTGNDYPFVIQCSETVSGLPQLLLMISGNIGFDSTLQNYVYNQNITTNTGDYSTIYINPGQYGGIPGYPDEAEMRGWVYVAWHYFATDSGTVVHQFTKFGIDGAVIATPPAIINGMGGWPPPDSPAPEFVTPVSICVGGGDRGSARIFMQYAKVYAINTPPSLSEVNSIALMTKPDTSAWADWPLIEGDMRDVSGHKRNLTIKGTANAGIEGPKLK